MSKYPSYECTFGEECIPPHVSAESLYVQFVQSAVRDGYCFIPTHPLILETYRTSGVNGGERRAWRVRGYFTVLLHPEVEKLITEVTP